MSLAALLRQHIGAQGPLPIEDYMRLALSHPQFGYYRKARPIGAAGDFITAPEISQLFGELLGVWSIASWHAMGRPAPFTLIEAGPGRGTLMQDALRAIRHIAPDMLATMRVLLVEVHPDLKTMQGGALRPFPISIDWQEEITPLPAMPVILLANEFLDALPIRQYARKSSGWHPRCVGLDKQGGVCLMTAPDPVTLPDAPPQAKSGDIYETCPEAHRIMQLLAAHARQHKLTALFIDYGHREYGWGDSLQAVRQHKPCAVTDSPGEADLTAHVDFARLADTARSAGAAIHGPVTQGHFLQELGIQARATQLAARATEAQHRDLQQAVQRLTGAEQMGQLFKVMAVSSPQIEALPGLEKQA